MINTKKSNLSWGFAQIWNESLEQHQERPVTPRNNLWASELGKSLVDNYLKMKGETPTNPPNMRSLRKFEAGNIWEWIVGSVLKRAGIYLGEQRWNSFRYPGLIEVTGKIDFLAGGKPDWEKAKAEIEQLGLPPFINRASENIINHFQKQYPEGMKTIVLENKSTSSFMFPLYEKFNFASLNHRLQAFHYLKAENLPEAHVVYVCKDDARMVEIGVFNPSAIENEYKGYIEKLTGYLQANELPPLEQPIEFDEETGQFRDNWKIKYSLYLTKLYGYKDQKDFEDRYRGVVAKYNRVLNRYCEEKKMTDKNKEIIAEIEKEFSQPFEKFVEIAAQRKAVLEKETKEVKN